MTVWWLSEAKSLLGPVVNIAPEDIHVPVSVSLEGSAVHVQCKSHCLGIKTKHQHKSKNQFCQCFAHRLVLVKNSNGLVSVLVSITALEEIYEKQFHPVWA